MDVAVCGVDAYYAVAEGDGVGVGVGVEFAAYLDGPDLSLHSRGVGGVEVGLGEFLEFSESHDADSDADLVVSGEFDVLDDFV